MVDVVDNESFRGVHNHSMHLQGYSLSVPECCSDGVQSASAAVEVPVILGEPFVIFRVHDSVFALAQQYPPEAIAVAQAAVNEGYKNRRPFQPYRNRYGKRKLDTRLRGFE